MNNNRLMALFLVFAMAMPSTLQAHMNISLEALKANWFQAVDLIKNNNGAKVIALFAVGTTGLSIGLWYKLYQLNKEKKDIERKDKIINTDREELKAEIRAEVITGVINDISHVLELVTHRVDKPVERGLKEASFSVLSEHVENPLLINMLIIARRDAWRRYTQINEILTERQTKGYGIVAGDSNSDISNIARAVHFDIGDKPWHDECLGVGKAPKIGIVNYHQELDKKRLQSIDTHN